MKRYGVEQVSEKYTFEGVVVTKTFKLVFANLVVLDSARSAGSLIIKLMGIESTRAQSLVFCAFARALLGRPSKLVIFSQAGEDFRKYSMPDAAFDR